MYKLSLCKYKLGSEAFVGLKATQLLPDTAV